MLEFITLINMGPRLRKRQAGDETITLWRNNALMLTSRHQALAKLKHPIVMQCI